jgi:hypothetical protein
VRSLEVVQGGKKSVFIKIWFELPRLLENQIGHEPKNMFKMIAGVVAFVIQYCRCCALSTEVVVSLLFVL